PNKSITEEEWMRIERYYLKNAPKSIVVERNTIDGPPESFQIEDPKARVIPAVTLLRYDSIRERIFAGTRTSRLFILDNKFSITDSLLLSSPPSDYITLTRDSLHVLQMGKMDPNDLPNGSLVAIGKTPAQKKILIDSLKRPVHMVQVDFDSDGDNDILISCFGNFTGNLSLFENQSGKFIRHLVHHLPGTRRTLVRDVNGDGLLDIIALITQGNDQIVLFTIIFIFNYRTTVMLNT